LNARYKNRPQAIGNGSSVKKYEELKKIAIIQTFRPQIVIEKYQGAIEVDSVLGQNTIFTI
jgi:hypothetical protein